MPRDAPYGLFAFRPAILRYPREGRLCNPVAGIVFSRKVGRHNNEQTDSPTDLEYNECQIEAQEFVYFSIRRTISLFVVVFRPQGKCNTHFPRTLTLAKEVIAKPSCFKVCSVTGVRYAAQRGVNHYSNLMEVKL